ncbi:MAG: RidA family protein [Alphaproteobacteria bacterium]
MAGESEKRLADLGLTLPEASSPVANYVPFHVHNGTLYISGQLPRSAEGAFTTGKLGAGVSVEDGQEAAKLACLNVLAQAKAALGSLDRIKQVLRLTVFVNATPDFTDHPQVANGASDFMVTVLQDAGRHTRAAVGVASLPIDAAVEIDAVLAVE